MFFIDTLFSALVGATPDDWVAQLGFVALGVFLGGITRGLAGFGFPLVSVTMLVTVFEPQRVVPVVVCLQIVAGALSLITMARQVDWSLVGHLTIGCCFGVPVGVWLLQVLPMDVFRISVGIFVVVAATTLGLGWRLSRRPGVGFQGGVGLISGVLHGAASMSGPPVVIAFLSMGLEPKVMRATLSFYFAVVGVIAIGVLGVNGLVMAATPVAAALLVPLLMLGIGLGSAVFRWSRGRGYRTIALVLLIIVGSGAVARGLSALI